MTATSARFFVLSVAAHAGLLVALWQLPTPQPLSTRAPAALAIHLIETPLRDTPLASPTPPATTTAPIRDTRAPTTSPHVASPTTRATSTNQPLDADRGGMPASVSNDVAVSPAHLTPSPADYDAIAVMATRAPIASVDAPPASTDAIAKADSEIIDALRERLRSAVAARFVYPPLARRQGWQGEVRLGLRVNADGHLSGIHLVASSGHGILDRAALRSLTDVQRLDGAADWLNMPYFDMVLPIQYQLIGG